MNKSLKGILLLVILFVFSGCSQHENVISNLAENVETQKTEIIEKYSDVASTGLPKMEAIQVKFSRHIDGDTSEFLVNNEKIKVRYLLIDTPETVKKDTPVQPFGLEASNRTKELLENASSIEIMLDEGNETDNYDRILAYVFVDGNLVQDVLVREGLACIAFVKSPSTYYLDDLMLSEAEAKASGIGIWSIKNYVVNGHFNRVN